jgi:prophage DNA circulation protein
MGSIRDIRNVWRDNLVPASFRGAVFHVETSSRASGRRTVLHQYPKRNIPYAEDMGREAVRWNFNGYLILRDKGIGGNLLSQIGNLLGALEADEAGMLIHPTLGAMLVQCERYSYSDKRTAGGYVEFDMQFVEAGMPASAGIMDAGANLTDSAGAAETSASSSMSTATGTLAPGGGTAGTIPP